MTQTYWVTRHYIPGTGDVYRFWTAEPTPAQVAGDEVGANRLGELCCSLVDGHFGLYQSAGEAARLNVTMEVE